MAKRKPKKPDSLAPTTQPSDPQNGNSNRGMMMLPTRAAGVVVNEDTGMTQSTVWACIRVVSESLAGMPWNVGQLSEDSTVRNLPHHDLFWMLNFAANPETEAFTFRETLWAWALGWGNGYAEIERNLKDEPLNLWQLHPSRVRPYREDDGSLWYEVANDGAQPSYIPSRNMFHLRGPSPDGIVGYSVIRMHARTIGLAIAQEQNAATFNENDSTPGGILTAKERLTDTARQNIEKSWANRHQGPSKRRTVAVLEEGLTWQQTGINPDDSNLVEQMQLTPAMICRIFRVPPHKVADLSKSTNNNIEHQDREFVNDTLRPWAERGEGEANLKLFGRNNQGRLVTVIDMSERERGDTSTQTQHVKEMTFCGIYSVDEARNKLGLPPIGSAAGGDKRFVQSAMMLLENAGEEPPNPPGSPPSATGTQGDAGSSQNNQQGSNDAQMSIVHNAAMLVVEDALRRISKREDDAGHLTGDARKTWKVKHAKYCREALAPAASVLAACFSMSPAATEVALSVFLDSHMQSDETWEVLAKAQNLRECLVAASAAKGVA